MQIEISDGKSIIVIKSTDIGSYFVMEKPLSLIWNDCDGSLGQYFTLTHYSNSEREKMVNKTHEKLYNDYTNNELLIVRDLSDLFNLFENGLYEIIFEKEIDNNLFLSYNESLRMTNYILFLKQKQLESISTYSNWNKKENIGYFSNCFYDDSYGENNFLFTRAMESINYKRVVFFENEIKEGKRPFAIVIRKEYTEKGIDPIEHQNSGWFIVDGHHKLVAYQNLKTRPAILRIKQIVSKTEYYNFNLSELSDVLMKCQYEHIKSNMK
jgi:hypothetical protein